MAHGTTGRKVNGRRHSPGRNHKHSGCQGQPSLGHVTVDSTQMNTKGLSTSSTRGPGSDTSSWHGTSSQGTRVRAPPRK
eukprot:11326099-Prorocentrum_lima.AAC.1